ncbi:hypothetical protein [Nocardia cyriacigeorgica]|uniref:hypothetical protein n=1 Tax=Nocardia cyriacigeorgica TaxID=135487 RepID=UPI002454F57D|nr:hypothetical protein [Nocardia cyriacigeorgica]
MEAKGGAGHELLPPANAEQARVLTAQLRDAIADVRRAGVVLADRVRSAHRARVWLALGFRSWADYAHAEFGISRAQAYRLVEIAETNQQLLEAGTALGLSPARDLGLSGRALRDLHGRVDEFAHELADLLRSSSGPLTATETVDLMHAAARRVRQRLAEGGEEQAVHPAVRSGHVHAEQLRSTAAALGELLLELAPAYRGETEVEDVVSRFADDVNLPAETAMAYRRYAITGDIRCLDDP